MALKKIVQGEANSAYPHQTAFVLASMFFPQYLEFSWYRFRAPDKLEYLRIIRDIFLLILENICCYPSSEPSL